MNNSTNQGNFTSDECVQLMDTSTKTALVILYALVFPVSLLGNSMVLYVVYKRRSMRNALNLLIVNMAIADLFITLLIMPYTVVFLYVQFQWFGGIIGDITCKLIHLSLTTSVAASILTLVVMTCDRFISIVFIWKQSLSLRSSKTVIAIIWLCSLALMGIHLAVFKVVKVGDQDICIPDWSFSASEFPKYFALGLFIILYALPLTLMAVMYFVIIRYLRKNAFSSFASSGGDSSIRDSKTRVIKMLMTVTTAFAVCWFPLHLNHYFMYFDLVTYSCLPFYVIALSFFIGHANSAVNPFIYVFFNHSFKRAFKDALGIRKYESLRLQTNNTKRSKAQTIVTQNGNGIDNETTIKATKKGSTCYPSVSIRQKTLSKLVHLPKSTANEHRYSTLVVSEKITSL